MPNAEGDEQFVPSTVSPFTVRQRCVKRAFDLVISIPIMILLSPVFFLLSLAVGVSSRGPIIYKAHRIGLYGEPFTMYKFRSMVETHASRTHKIVGHKDHRVTTVGRFIRRTKLDELPQLLNVINGTMSIVGPRPQNADFIARYSESERAVLQIRPGITGPGTVVNYERILTGSTPEENEKIYFEKLLPERLQCELEYIQNWSLKIDLLIVMRTLTSMFSRSDERKTTPLYRPVRN